VDEVVKTMQYSILPEPFGHGGTPFTSSVPTPSLGIVSFNWNSLKEKSLPSFTPIHMVVGVNFINVYCSIVDEEASISILSSDAWKAMGSPKLLIATFF